MQKNCIILASGNGSNALNLINRFYINKTGSSLINISAVVSNVEGAPVIDKVKKRRRIFRYFFCLMLPFQKETVLKADLKP
jgi:Folate-dependent phosphoribosylglycinamide formyltransferase PurN